MGVLWLRVTCWRGLMLRRACAELAEVLSMGVCGVTGCGWCVATAREPLVLIPHAGRRMSAHGSLRQAQGKPAHHERFTEDYCETINMCSIGMGGTEQWEVDWSISPAKARENRRWGSERHRRY